MRSPVPVAAVIASLIWLASPRASAQGAASCPPGDFTITAGAGVVQASDLESGDEGSTLYDACLEARGWAIRAARFSYDDASDTLTAAGGVRLATTGASGTADALTATGDAVDLDGVNLEVRDGFRVEGQDAAILKGRARLVAAHGRIAGGRLDVNGALIDRFDARGAIVERFRADRAVIEGGVATVTGLGFATRGVSLTGASGEVNDTDVRAFSVNGTLCRDPSAADLRFSAREATVDELGVAHVTEPSVGLFGLWLPPFPGSIDVDTRRRLEIPVRVGLDGGLMFGLEGYRVRADGDVRVTLLGHRLFTAKPSLSFALYGAVDGTSFYFGQPLDDALRVTAGADPASGPTFNFAVNTGRNVVDTAVAKDMYEEARGGYAQRVTLGPLAVRGKAEVGQAWQPALNPNPAVPSSLEQAVVFARANVNASVAVPLGPLTASASGTATAAVYGGERAAGVTAASVTAAFGLRYALPWLSLSGGVAYAQTFAPAPLRIHATDSFTRASFNARFTPEFAAVPLGFDGLAVEHPRFGVDLEVNLRSDASAAAFWRVQALEASVDLAWYGVRSVDAFGNAFQTPIVKLAPHVRYDFASIVRGYQEGVFGADVTVYSCCFGFTVGASRVVQNFPGGKPAQYSWRFNVGVEFR